MLSGKKYMGGIVDRIGMLGKLLKKQLKTL